MTFNKLLGLVAVCTLIVLVLIQTNTRMAVDEHSYVLIHEPTRLTLSVATGSGPITWAISDGVLPPGLTLDANTGIIGGEPSEAGRYIFTATAKNSSGATSKTFAITVYATRDALAHSPQLVLNHR